MKNLNNVIVIKLRVRPINIESSLPNEFLNMNSRLALSKTVDPNCKKFELTLKRIESRLDSVKKSTLCRQTSTAAALQAMAK
jgi:hypothetical protein